MVTWERKAKCKGVLHMDHRLQVGEASSGHKRAMHKQFWLNWRVLVVE